jgi:hypothetical protein
MASWDRLAGPAQRDDEERFEDAQAPDLALALALAPGLVDCPIRGRQFLQVLVVVRVQKSMLALPISPASVIGFLTGVQHGVCRLDLRVSR